MRPFDRLGLRLMLSLLLTALAGATTRADAPRKKPLAVEDLYRLDAPRSAVLSPDGKRAVYARVWIDPKSKRERSSLWVVDAPGKQRPLEKGEPDARSPVFSPDGKWVAFLSTRVRPKGWKQTVPAPPQSDPATDVWLVPADGGPAVPLAGPEKTYGRVFNDGFYGRLAFAPDGKRLAFIAGDGADPRTPEEIEANVEVVREDQGEGYTGYGPAQLWVAHLDAAPGKSAAGRIDRLTRDEVWYGDPQWSPDGKFLVVHANRTRERESVRFSINRDFDLWAIDAETKAVRRLTTGPGPEVSPRFSPDGKRIACLSVPRKGSHRDVFNLAIVTLGDGEPKTEILFDHHGPGADKPPHVPPTFPFPDHCWQGNGHVIYLAEARVGTVMSQVDVATGKGTLLGQPAVGKTERVPTESLVGRAMRLRQLIPEGNAFLRERELGESKVVRWKSTDGLEIEGILTTPPPSVAKAPYKLLLHPHGGPHSRSALGFDFTVQAFAAHGYAVFQPNFRGSHGYGQKFIDADRKDLGGGDVNDILSGIEYLVEQKLADPSRQFVYGSSYGGFLTCWLVGHTDQFRAAVAQNAVTDMTAMWGLSDLQSWVEWEVGGRPWEAPDAMRKHSPLTYVGKVKTPTLVLHCREDRRVPLPMGRMFYQSLKARGVPTEMVIYPGEGHGIRDPRHRVDVLRRALAWFARHGG